LLSASRPANHAVAFLQIHVIGHLKKEFSRVVVVLDNR